MGRYQAFFVKFNHVITYLAAFEYKRRRISCLANDASTYRGSPVDLVVRVTIMTQRHANQREALRQKQTGWHVRDLS